MEAECLSQIRKNKEGEGRIEFEGIDSADYSQAEGENDV